MLKPRAPDANLHLFQRKHGQINGPFTDEIGRHKRSQANQRVGQQAQHLVVIPHEPAPVCALPDRQMKFPPRWRPWARDYGWSFQARCWPQESKACRTCPASHQLFPTLRTPESDVLPWPVPLSNVPLWPSNRSGRNIEYCWKHTWLRNRTIHAWAEFLPGATRYYPK